MRVTFLIPAYNEAETIGEVLDRVEALECDKQLIVVDDGSTDTTPTILSAWTGRDDVLVIRQSNRGKGAAIRAAIPWIDGEIAVIQDADLEYDPADVPALIEPIERGVADVVFGSRLSGGRPQRAYMFWHLVGNRFLSLMTNVLFNTTLTDMETGYKAFRVDVLQSLSLREDDFGIEPEITGQICKRNLRIYELPIAYYGRTYDEGKKISWRDGTKAMRVLLRVRLSNDARRELPRRRPLERTPRRSAVMSGNPARLAGQLTSASRRRSPRTAPAPGSDVDRPRAAMTGR
jgi:glycosyltransferase involved in cell wall biosynthesis